MALLVASAARGRPHCPASEHLSTPFARKPGHTWTSPWKLDCLGILLVTLVNITFFPESSMPNMSLKFAPALSGLRRTAFPLRSKAAA